MVLHIGFTTRNSTINTTAAIIIAAKAALGIYEKYGVKNNNEHTTMALVYRFPSGVLTPLALFTALRLSEPVPGNPCTKEFAIFETPIAISSCVASTGFPFAVK